MAVNLIRGKYQLVREIARSNDVVYEALDTTLGRRIALKELNIAPGLTGQARRDRIERFNREARAAGRLSHPNIVSVFDFGEEQTRHFIAMEYLEGQTLRDIINVRGALPVAEAIDIACQVLDGLAYAHMNHVIHRDIKPDNIHILPGGQVKLTDFGIARITEEPGLTSGGEIFGTPSYMSPEQIEGRGLDHRSDIFSLGVVLYEMLAGRKPFVGDSVISITYGVMNAEPPVLAGVPAAVDRVVRLALAKSPAQRYQSADQMERDLRSAGQMPATMAPAQPFGSTMLGYGGAQVGFPASYGSGAFSAPPPVFGAPAGPAAPGAMSSGGPWAWNTVSPASNPGFPQGAPSGNPAAPAGSQQPGAYAFPAFAARRRVPSYWSTPGGKALLTSLVLAALLGGGIAVTVLVFLRSYDQFSRSIGYQRSAALIEQGAKAYDGGVTATDTDQKGHQFRYAAQLFERALLASPGPDQKATIDHNLGATYVQLARLAMGARDWQDAADLYAKALDHQPDNQVAHLERADALDHLGQTDAAAEERAAANGKSVAPSSADTTPAETEQQFMNQQRAQAADLIQQGDNLYNGGDVSGARDKWLQAMEAAPGTPERDQAKQRLDQTTPGFHSFDEP